MITKEDLTETLKMPEDKATQVLELLGDFSKNLTSDLIVEKRVNKAFGDVELEILKSTGIKKNDGEKATEYLSRSIPLLIEAKIKDKEDSLNGEIATLKEQIKNHKGDETLKKQLEDTKNELSELKKNHDKTIEDTKKEWEDKYNDVVKGRKDDNDIHTLRNSIPGNLKKEYSHDYIDYKIKQSINKAREQYDTIEKNDKGEVILKDSSLKLSSVKATDFFSNDLKEIIEEQRSVSGGGGGDKDKGKKSELVIADDMSNNEKYQKIKEYVIVGLGLSPVTKEFQEKMKELQVQHGLLKETKK